VAHIAINRPLPHWENAPAKQEARSPQFMREKVRAMREVKRVARRKRTEAEPTEKEKQNKRERNERVQYKSP